MDFGSIFNAVSGLLNQHTRDNDSVDTDGLIGQIGNVFQQHGASPEQVQNPYAQGDANQGILPASQDPYGDPADQQGGILPASQDPLGDPADQQ